MSLTHGLMSPVNDTSHGTLATKDLDPDLLHDLAINQPHACGHHATLPSFKFRLPDRVVKDCDSPFKSIVYVMPTIEIHVQPQMRPFVDSALTRAGYLYPNLYLEKTSSGILVSGDFQNMRSDCLKRDILHLLYREKIYVETLPIKRALLECLTKM